MKARGWLKLVSFVVVYAATFSPGRAWGACGDGALDSGEACDDGNGLWGDGCAADCSWGDYDGFANACLNVTAFEDNGNDDEVLDGDDEILSGTTTNDESNAFYTTGRGFALEFLEVNDSIQLFIDPDGGGFVELFDTPDLETGDPFEEGGLDNVNDPHADGLPRLVVFLRGSNVRFFGTLTQNSALIELEPTFTVGTPEWGSPATRVAYDIGFPSEALIRHPAYTYCLPLPDHDGDQVPDSADGDDDADGIPDRIDNQDMSASNADDPDDDGLSNSFDLDSNNDGIPDLVACWGLGFQGGRPGIVSSPLDEDGDEDGIPDAFDASGGCAGGDGDVSPDDGICDSFQDGTDTDHDGYDDEADWDDDGDGIFDEGPGEDFGCWREDGSHRDTDGDGQNDQVDLDLDDDSLPTVDELEGSFDLIGRRLDLGGADDNGDGLHDDIVSASFLGDGDDDGIPDAFDPGDPDSDGDDCSDEDECEDGWPCTFDAGYPDYMNDAISVCEDGPSGVDDDSEDPAFDGVTLGGGPSCGALAGLTSGWFWVVLFAPLFGSRYLRRRFDADARRSARSGTRGSNQ